MTIFVVCTIAIFALYEIFVIGPRERQHQADVRAQAVAARTQPVQAPGAMTYVDRTQALAASPRARIDTPVLQGSVSLKGGRIDDLFLKDYRETLAKDSPPVELLRPEGARQAYFTDFGWTGAAATPGPLTVWRESAGGALSPGHPVILSWDNGAGLSFTRTVAVDARYMFTVTDAVTNRGDAPVTLAPYASVQRQGQPELGRSVYNHEGAIGWLNGQLRLQAFKNWKKKGDTSYDSTGGWLGLTNGYWLAALIPDQQGAMKAQYRVDTVSGVDVFETDYVSAPRTLAPGAATASTTRVFAGAKKVAVLKDYQAKLGISHFDDAVDWGMLWFLTRPIFWLLMQFYDATGNFGVALLILTVVVKLVTFPLANRSYASASQMKKLQPEVEAIKKKFKDEPQKQQQETMALYQREKVNPIAGCLPALIPLPIFFALYKVLFVSIEMRHAPFIGWIQDLSAPDPSTLWNLFGLIPWNPGLLPAVGGFLDGPLHIGFWALLYGFIMWLNMAMTPQAGVDASQRQIMQLMPVMFIFFFAHLPAGLLIYYCWSTALTILQQYVIMHRYKTENPIDSFIARMRNRDALPAPG